MILALVEPCRDVVDALDGAALLHEELRARVEVRQAEIHRLAPLGRVGHRLGDEVYRVGGQERDAGGRCGLLLLDLDRLADGLLDLGLDQRVDQVDGEADPLVVLVDVGERRRAGAGTDHQLSGILYLVQRVLGQRRCRHERHGQDEHEGERTLHRSAS
jgi:hypothetical protein